MSDELARLDAVAQAELVQRGEIKPSELVDAAIARAEKLDPQLNAIVLPSFEKARTQAGSALWDARAPLDHFQAMLDFWVNTHADAVDQYLKVIGNGKNSAPGEWQ